MNIETESLNQLNEYKAAIESLKDSVNRLNEEIIKYNAQNRETVTWGSKVKTTVKDLFETFKTGKEIIESLSMASKGWAGILSAAFTLITTYGPQILNFLGNMFESDKAREAAETLETYNDVMENYKSNMSEEVSKLHMLVTLANSEKLSKEAKLEVIKKLNNLSPKYLGNLTAENIKTKEGIDLLTEYTASLNRKAMEQAIQEKRVALIRQRLDLKPEYERTKQKYEDFKTGKTPNKREKQDGYMLNGNYISGTDIDLKRDARIEFFKNAQKDFKILRSIQQLDNMLAETFVKFAPKIELNKTHDKSYWESQLAEEQRNLNKLDATSNEFEKKSKTTVKKIEALKKILNNYDVLEKKVTSNPTPHAAHPKVKITRLEELLPAKALSYADQAVRDKEQYDKELLVLQGFLEQKLISQEEFKKRSWELEDKYHQGLGGKMEEFLEKHMAATQKQLQQEIDARRQESAIKQDEKDIKKAILPGDKFAAEKKLIDDKYTYDLLMAGDNAEKKKELEIKHQEDTSALTQKYEQARKEFALNTAQQVSDKAFSIISSGIKSSSEAKIKALEADKAGELANKNLTATQRKAIEDKYKKKENEEKLRAFKAEQRSSVMQAIVNGALAITKATAQTGIGAPFVIPGIIASTALQIATIIKQKPGFAYGGQFISDGRGAVLPGYSRIDNTNAYLRSGEAVVVSEAMRNPWARNLVSAINVAHGGRDFSVPNSGRGYAIGGIFTDGGNANRYYNQPVNDIKDMANTLAYQMINNFPPIYVDVKDVNNQQNILAQTVNRVNL